jgi:hypothetical protein
MPDSQARTQERPRGQSPGPISGVALRAGRDLSITFIGGLDGLLRGLTGRLTSAADTNNSAPPTPAVTAAPPR